MLLATRYVAGKPILRSPVLRLGIPLIMLRPLSSTNSKVLGIADSGGNEEASNTLHVFTVDSAHVFLLACDRNAKF